MTISLKESTREAFAAQTHISDKNVSVTTSPTSYFVSTESGNFYVSFLTQDRNETHYFAILNPDKSLGRMLTREEATSVLKIIEENLGGEERDAQKPIIDRLWNNLPNLGFGTPTLLMTYTPPKTQNARTWCWSLNCE